MIVKFFKKDWIILLLDYQFFSCVLAAQNVDESLNNNDLLVVENTV